MASSPALKSFALGEFWFDRACCGENCFLGSIFWGVFYLNWVRRPHFFHQHSWPTEKVPKIFLKDAGPHCHCTQTLLNGVSSGLFCHWSSAGTVGGRKRDWKITGDKSSICWPWVFFSGITAISLSVSQHWVYVGFCSFDMRWSRVQVRRK